MFRSYKRFSTVIENCRRVVKCQIFRERVEKRVNREYDRKTSSVPVDNNQCKMTNPFTLSLTNTLNGFRRISPSMSRVYLYKTEAESVDGWGSVGFTGGTPYSKRFIFVLHIQDVHSNKVVLTSLHFMKNGGRGPGQRITSSYIYPESFYSPVWTESQSTDFYK